MDKSSLRCLAHLWREPKTMKKKLKEKKLEKLGPIRNIMPSNLTLELTSDEFSLQYDNNKI
jgi:hypothetical protein